MSLVQSTDSEMQHAITDPSRGKARHRGRAPCADLIGPDDVHHHPTAQTPVLPPPRWSSAARSTHARTHAQLPRPPRDGGNRDPAFLRVTQHGCCDFAGRPVCALRSA